MYNIEKLDETNYDSWSLQIKAVLIHQDLWSTISDDKPTAQDQIAAWTKRDEKATSTIILSVTPMQISYIKSYSSACATWNTLRDIHRPKGPVRKVTLFKQLLNMRMSESDCVQQYVCNFSSIVEKLAETGIELQDELFAIMLLASLPTSYENFVIALETRDELPKLSALKLKLTEEGERRKAGEQITQHGGAQVFMSQSNNKINNNNNISSNRINVNNNRNEKNNRQSGKQKQNFNCFKCGRRGHYAAQCRNGKPETSNRTVQQERKDTHAYSVFAATNDNNVLNKDVWCLDSGATSHICCNRSFFETFVAHVELITLADQSEIKAEGRGTVRINECNIVLNDVLFIPNLQCNFISVGRIAVKDVVKFNSREAKIMDENGKTILCAEKLGDLFLYTAKKNTLYMTTANIDEVMKWHNRYGHLNVAGLSELSRKKLVNGLNIQFPNEINCTTCLKSKCTTKPFSSSENRATELLEIIHTDICGPVNVNSSGGARYILTFIDDYSRYVFVYFLKNKSQTFETFKEFKAMVECQTGRRIKMLRSDNGTEFVNKVFDEFLKLNGIKRQLTVPHTPQQNGVAERFNRTLVEMARAMLVYSGVDESLWAEAVNTAAYLRNRSPTKALNNCTPYEVWCNKKPSVRHLKVFGSLAIALDKTHHHKFRPKGKQYIMVGYSETSKAYRLFEKTTGKIIISRDVYFIENDFVKEYEPEQLSKSDDNIFTILMEPIVENIIREDQNQEDSEFESAEEDYPDPDAVMRGSELVGFRTKIENQKAAGRPKLVRTGQPGRPRKQYNTVNLICAENIKVPATVNEALSGEYSPYWLSAMQEEYKALLDNDTWELSELPHGQKVVGCKWVYAIKKNKEGHIERFKARLVAKGYAQTYGINYTETFSPVVRYETIRMVIALAAEYELHLHQMDVSTAYLNSDLTDEVYMAQPEHFTDERFPEKVLKLKKALYGLKQSGRQWNLKLDEILKGIGFHPCESEPCLYRRENGSNINLIAVYVDDLLIACSDLNELNQIKSQIAEKVSVVDKGPAKNFLSIEIERDGATGQITIHQNKYIRELLHEYKMEECRPVSTPLEPKFQVICENDNCEKVNPTLYQSLIGSLMYLAICTRPDILHSVCKLSQRNKDPHHEHMAAARRLLKYLNKSANYELRYRKTGQPVICYADADWGGDASNRKSYTGYVFILAGSAFSWESKKQATVALSSTEAEYMALSSAAKEAVFLKKLLSEVKIHCPEKILIYGDNLGAIHLVKNPIYHSRSKHIDIKYHHIRNVFSEGLIDLQYCNSNSNISDVFTKNLSKDNHIKFVEALGFVNL